LKGKQNKAKNKKKIVRFGPLFFCFQTKGYQQQQKPQQQQKRQQQLNVKNSRDVNNRMNATIVELLEQKGIQQQ
jgi:hypothetical protein